MREMALVALGELGGDELGRASRDHLLAEAPHRGFEQFVVAPQPAALEEGGADGHVLLRERDQLAGRADRMADLELQVPQQMEDRFGRRFDVGARRLGGQHHQVEVAVGRHLPAAGAAEADQRDLAADRRADHALGHIIVSEADDLVVEEGQWPARRRGRGPVLRSAAGRSRRARPRAPRAGSRTPRCSASCPAERPRSVRSARADR